MEIQFSIPLQSADREGEGASTAAESSSKPTSASKRSAGIAATRGGTHRFALDSRTRHTRRSSTRARTGCSICKKRHVKCDETKPSCLNCMKWRGYCDGYSDASSTRSETPASTQPRTDVDYPADSIKLIHTKKAPLLIEEPDVNSIRFASEEQRSYFMEWSALSMKFLSGSMGDSRLWVVTMPQVTSEEPALRYAAMAIGALRKACSRDAEFETAAIDSVHDNNKHYLNAIVYYCEALRAQARAKPNEDGLRTALLASLLFICFEAQRGNLPAALKHVTHGFGMLNELAACTPKAPGLMSMAPAPPALVQELLDCYKPLELQLRSFVGSLQKLKPPPRPVAPQPESSQSLPIHPSSSSSPNTAPSPPSQPGSPWQSNRPSPPDTTGLPSPQSQCSPGSQGEQAAAPPRRPPPPQRPPGIAPFTKHSPYFRPKKSGINNWENIPIALTTFDEANGYWSLLQRQMVQYLPFLTMSTIQLALPRAKDEDEVEAKLASFRNNPKIIHFLEESRSWLHRWDSAFDPFLRTCIANQNLDRETYLRAINIRIEYLILYVYTAMPRYEDIHCAQSLTPVYREINIIGEILISSRPNCGFAMDSGWTWPVFVSAFGCRDAAVKDDAIRILRQYPVRNALRDSRIFQALALKNREVETSNALEGDERSQWLRLCRREFAFEDLGSSVIFRSVQKDPQTGRWELFEESAPVKLGPDGTLRWTRQPVTDSPSLLSGVS